MHWPYVLLSVAGIACLGFCGTVFDPSGVQTTLFGLARQIHEGGIIPDISMSVPVIWQQGLGSWLALFAPLLVSLGYVVTLSSERQNGQMKFELIRGGNFRYSVSKVVSGALFSGAMFLAGYALFAASAETVFPGLFFLWGGAAVVLPESLSREFCDPVLCLQTGGSILFWSIRRRIWNRRSCFPGR